MDKQYYKDYYHFEREHWWYKARKNILQYLIEKKIYKSQPLKILNVGTATGATSLMLQNFGEVTSVEYDDDCVAFVNSLTNLNVQKGDITQLQFNNESFDLVCAFDVVEHVKEDKKAVDELMRVCKTNGHVFITTPAFMFLWSEHDVVNHHIKRYTKKELGSLFESHNSTFIIQSYFNSILFLPIAAVRVLLWPFQKLRNKNKPVESDFSRFNTGFVSKLLFSIFNSEKHVLNNFSLPFGVSIAIMVNKTANQSQN